MKISTEIGSAARFIGEERAIEYVAQTGFDAWDFSMFRMCGYNCETRENLGTGHPLSGPDYLSFARKLKQVGLDNGIVCNQSHAPFPSIGKNIIDYLKRAIECTAEAGGQICVIHPANDGTVEENAALYSELLPFAKEHGIKIAAENMFNRDPVRDQACFAACATPESFRAHFDAVGDDSFVACLDIGHAELDGLGTSAVEMIHALGDRGKLQALHIHDNDLWSDWHQLPFTMDIDFDAVIAALKEVGYSGYLTLEANAFIGKYYSGDVFGGIKKIAEAGKKLAAMFDAV